MFTRDQFRELLSTADKEDIPYLVDMYKDTIRSNFYEFCVYFDSVFFTDVKIHLKLIADIFQRVTNGQVKKIAISLPPRAGKSYITSLWCAWMLGKYPHGSVMRNSYGATLAEKFSRDIRDGILQKPKYTDLFPSIAVSKKLSAVEGWALEGYTQPSYFCAGVGGPITGFGCKTVAILDDPIKNIEDALSETIINKTWDWYTSTHLSRLETECPEIHIATRWSKKDPIGRLTDQESKYYDPSFETVVIPALNDKGESFCEEIKTTKEYYEIKKVTDEIIWEAEFMQNPIESKGLLFPVEELNRFKLAELNTNMADAIIGFTDTADEGTDYLCSVVGKKYKDKTYIVDVIYTQDPVEITEPLIAQQIIDCKTDIHKIESNSGGKSFCKNVRNLIKSKSGCSVIDEHQSKNKETRILMNAGYIKENFFFRDDYEVGSMYDRFMRALTSYVKLGKNKNDDAPDATTGLAEYIKLNVIVPRPKQELQGGFYTKGELEDMGYKQFEIKRVT